jgi:hypothetical protein
MEIVLAMWTIWGVFLLLFIAAKLYSSRLSRNEDDQLILQDSSGILKAEQAAILGKINKFRPIQVAASWALGAGSLLVVAYYIHDMVSQFK